MTELKKPPEQAGGVAPQGESWLHKREELSLDSEL